MTCWAIKICFTIQIHVYLNYLVLFNISTLEFFQERDLMRESCLYFDNKKIFKAQNYLTVLMSWIMLQISSTKYEIREGWKKFLDFSVKGWWVGKRKLTFSIFIFLYPKNAFLETFPYKLCDTLFHRWCHIRSDTSCGHIHPLTPELGCRTAATEREI